MCILLVVRNAHQDDDSIPYNSTSVGTVLALKCAKRSNYIFNL